MSFTAIFPSIGYDYSNPQTILESLKKSLFGGSTIQPSYTAISIKVVDEQSGKVEYERERLLGIALKIH